LPTAPYSKDWFDKLPEEVQKRYPKTRIILEGKKGIGLKEDIEGEEFYEQIQTTANDTIQTKYQ